MKKWGEGCVACLGTGPRSPPSPYSLSYRQTSGWPFKLLNSRCWTYRVPGHITHLPCSYPGRPRSPSHTKPLRHTESLGNCTWLPFTYKGLPFSSLFGPWSLFCSSFPWFPTSFLTLGLGASIRILLLGLLEDNPEVPLPQLQGEWAWLNSLTLEYPQFWESSLHQTSPVGSCWLWSHLVRKGVGLFCTEQLGE